MVQSLLSLTEVRDAGDRPSFAPDAAVREAARGATGDASGFREYLTPERIDLLSSLAPLHDIGKVGVPDRILNKPGALTPEELAEMRKHPAHGRDVILKAEQQAGVRDDTTLAMAKDIVYTHHERWDGTGYPEGLSGTDIPVAGTSDGARGRLRRRRHAETSIGNLDVHDDTVNFIVSGKGTHFDPAVVDAFIGVAPEFERVFHEDEAQRKLAGES